MKEPKILAGKNQIISPSDHKFPLFQKKDMRNWLCFYEKKNYDFADTLFKCLEKASKAYNLNISEPEWVEMGDKSFPED